MHFRVSQLSTIKSQSLDKSSKTDSFDNNVWVPTLWKRFNYIAMSILTIIVHVSFTNIFGNNFWYFIIGYKILGIAVENIAEIFL